MLNINPKKIAFPAAFGFALFFLVSLIFTHKIVPALLRGVIFGLLFALIFFGIDFVFTRFLNDGEDISVSSGGSGAKRSMSSPGGTIDITISDEELTDDGQGLRFPVSKNKHALAKEETVPILDPNAAQKLKQDVSSLLGSTEPGFRSLDSVAPLQGSASGGSAGGTGTERSLEASASSRSPSPAGAAPLAQQSAGSEGAFTPVSLGKPFPSTNAQSSLSEKIHDGEKSELDDLPEIADFAPKAGDVGKKEEVIVDSDFARDGVKTSSSDKPMFADGSRATDHNTETLARAIQTVLKRDE